MNSKKFISTIAAGVIAATTVATPVINGAVAYSSELESAYTWAYDNGVTTVKGIDNANMMGNLTRVAMAKMLANYAINKLGRTPDTSITCNFSDVSAKMDADYDNGVTKACQLGIMGRDEGKVASSFNPNGIVTRAQFGTALSRVLWPNQVKDTNPYYVNHLNALKKAGIMTQINPDQKEVRGYVMIMLQRSAGMINNEKTEECSVAQQFLCILEEGDCPEACEGVVNNKDNNTQDDDGDKEVRSGNLTVNVEKKVDTKDIPAKGTVIADSIELSSSESITVNSITLKASDYTKTDNIEAVSLRKNGQTIANEKTSFIDNKITLTLKKGFTVKKSETIDIVVRTDAQPNAVIAFEVVEVKSSAEKAKIKNEFTTTCKTIAYDVATATIEPLGSAAIYDNDGESHEFAKFKISNDGGRNGKTINVSSITFTNSANGKADIDNLSDFEIVKNDGTVVSKDYTTNGKDEVVITLKDSIESQKSQTYILKAKVAEVDSSNDEYIFSIEENSDIVAYEDGTQAQIDFNVDTAIGFAKYSIRGGDVVLSTTNTTKTVKAPAGKSDILVAEGTFKAVESVVIKKKYGSNINGAALKIDSTDDSMKNLKAMRIVIDGRSVPADIVCTDGTDTVKCESAAVTEAYALFKDDIEIPAGTSKVKVYVDLVSNITGEIVMNNISASSFAMTGEYVENSEDKFSIADNFVGTLNVATVNVAAGDLILSKTSTETLTINQTKQDGVIFEGKIKNEESIDVQITSFVITGSAHLTGTEDTSKLSFEVSMNGKTTSADVRNWSLGDGSEKAFTFRPNGSIIVKAGDSVDVVVKVSSSNISDQYDSITVVAAVEGEETEGNSAKVGPSNSIQATVDVKPVTAKPVTASNNNAVIMHNSNEVVLAKGSIEVKNGSAQLSKVTITGSNFGVINSYMVKIEGLSSKSLKLEGNDLIANISDSLSEGTHAVEFVANVNKFTDAQKIAGSEIVEIDGMVIEFNVKENIPEQQLLTAPITKTIYPASVTIRKNSSSTSENLVLDIINNSSEDTIYLTNIETDTNKSAKMFVTSNNTKVEFEAAGTTYSAKADSNGNIPVVTIEKGKSAKVELSVSEKDSKVYINGVYYGLEEGSTAIETTSVNMGDFNWNDFYAKY